MKTKKPRLAKIIPLRKPAPKAAFKPTKKLLRMRKMMDVWQVQSHLAGMSPDDHIAMLFTSLEMMIQEGYSTREAVTRMFENTVGRKREKGDAS